MERSQSPKDHPDDARKVFITNIDGLQPQTAVENQLRRLFSRFGEVTKLNVKKNKNGLYSFAFLQFSKLQDATKAIGELDQYQLFGKRMRVRQDRQSEGCFHCKKSGHFARQCPENKDKEGKQPRQYSNRNRDREPNRDYRDRDDRYQKQRYYRQDRHRENTHDRRYRDNREEKYRRQRRGRENSRSYSPEYKRRGRNSPSRSRSASGNRDRYYRGPSPRRDRYYDERRRDRRDHRDQYYRRRRSYSSRSASER